VEVLPVAGVIVLRLEACVAGPRLDQRAVDGEMLVRQPWRNVFVMQQFLHEAIEHIALLQALAILRKCRRVPHRVVRRKPDEPAVQKIIVPLLHQLPFTPSAIKHLQQQRAQQLFGRDRRAPGRGIQHAEIAVQMAQHLAYQLAYCTERVLCPPPVAPAKYTKITVPDLQMFRACLTLRSS
jgi:hypothetical protein